MAYPPKEITTIEYDEYYSSIIENIQYNKIYLMPNIVDGSPFWTITFRSISEPEEMPYTTVRTPILSGYRVLLTRKIIAGPEQLFVVRSAGNDAGRPWIRADMVMNAADIEFEDLPIGTEIYWITRTLFPPAINKFTAQIDEKRIIEGEFAGMYLSYGTSPIVLPVGNVTAEGIFTKVYNINVSITDTDGEIIESRDYSPADNGILEFLPKNEIRMERL